MRKRLNFGREGCPFEKFEIRQCERIKRRQATATAAPTPRRRGKQLVMLRFLREHIETDTEMDI